MRAADMVDLRVDRFGVESFTVTRQHEENPRCCLREEDHREDAQGVEYVPTENGFVERVRVVGCRKVEGFGLPLNAGALAWFGTLPHLTLCECPKRVTGSDKPPPVLCHRLVQTVNYDNGLISYRLIVAISLRPPYSNAVYCSILCPPCLCPPRYDSLLWNHPGDFPALSDFRHPLYFKDHRHIVHPISPSPHLMLGRPCPTHLVASLHPSIATDPIVVTMTAPRTIADHSHRFFHDVRPEMT